MIEILLGVCLVLLAVLTGLLLWVARKLSRGENPALLARLEAFERTQESHGRALRDEFSTSRQEASRAAGAQREELGRLFERLGQSVSLRLTEAAGAQRDQLDLFSTRLEGMVNALGELSAATERRLDAVRTTVEAKLTALQEDNARQLEAMRQTVDEKLQGTLKSRLDQSFKLVSERLEQVHKGLGEMQTLATGVGDLKRVLTNVKTRGTWGEVQLGTLLEQVLSPDQFGTNVAMKDGGERVEFAIRLPGQGADRGDAVWLPIDAKFPVEDYQRLLDAQDRADPEGVEAAARQLETRIRTCAVDICNKYLNPPRTTDFGILFLPIEGLFAEAIRRPGLTERIQREYRVVIAGPTTLWSILNSLQMGFRTLAIQQRSSEVWTLLGAVKTEWARYGEVLDAVQKRLQQASETLDKARTRSRAVGRRLREVQELPAGEAAALLPPDPKTGEESAEDR